MRKKAISLGVCIFLFTVVASFSAVAQNPLWDKHEATTETNLLPPPGDAMWDVQYYFDVAAASGAAGNAGCEFDGAHFYSTRWASNLIHEYDLTGVLTKQFSITGVSGLRDLAYDGTYFYGGAAGGTIWQMDFTSQTLIGSIKGSFQSRAIAYDSDLDVFYCTNWADPVWIVDRAGATVGTFNLGLTATYGLAYDNVSAGGPYLWVHDQTAGGSVVYQWDLAAGAMTGVTHDVAADFPASSGIAGGAFFTTDFVAGTTTLGVLLQGVPDLMICYELEAIGGFTIAVDQWLANQVATLSVTGATPNNIVRAAYSMKGGGPTPTPYGVVLLSPPFNILPDLKTDGSGNASARKTLPNAPGVTIWVQAYDVGTGTLSNGLKGTIQ